MAEDTAPDWSRDDMLLAIARAQVAIVERLDVLVTDADLRRAQWDNIVAKWDLLLEMMADMNGKLTTRNDALKPQIIIATTSNPFNS